MKTSFQFSRSSRPVPDKTWISDAARSTQARHRIGIRSTKENKRSAGEELTQADYSKIESVVINCKFRLTIYPINRDIKSRTHELLTPYQVTRHNIYQLHVHWALILEHHCFIKIHFSPNPERSKLSIKSVQGRVLIYLPLYSCIPPPWRGPDCDNCWTIWL
jgi:hypothetical protein